jgi:serine/threonine protein kinase
MKSRQGIKEFKREVVVMAKLQHMNIVGLRGYCIKGEERIVLSEYMPNRSLNLFIFGWFLNQIPNILHA